MEAEKRRSQPYVPAKKDVDQKKEPVMIGRPTMELAFNDVIDSLNAYGLKLKAPPPEKLPFEKKRNRSKGEDLQLNTGLMMVENLAHVLRYISPFIETINERQTQLQLHLARLGFAFIKSTDAEKVTTTEVSQATSQPTRHPY